jgi:hypothetical protein
MQGSQVIVTGKPGRRAIQPPCAIQRPRAIQPRCAIHHPRGNRWRAALLAALAPAAAALAGRRQALIPAAGTAAGAAPRSVVSRSA